MLTPNHLINSCYLYVTVLLAMGTTWYPSDKFTFTSNIVTLAVINPLSTSKPAGGRPHERAVVLMAGKENDVTTKIWDAFLPVNL